VFYVALSVETAFCFMSICLYVCLPIINSTSKSLDSKNDRKVDNVMRNPQTSFYRAAWNADVVLR